MKFHGWSLKQDGAHLAAYKSEHSSEGALWTEESLPPESVLIGVLGADKSRHQSVRIEPDEVISKALPSRETALQFGGKATVGHGRCRLVRLG